jgi:NtrC-family two-component system sensor histidine kinase KinB
MPTFRRKILLGYGASLALVVAVLVWAVMSILSLGQASHSILQENYRSILAAEKMIDAIERQDSGLLLLLLGFPEQGLKEFQDHEPLFWQWLARAQDNITIAGEKAIVLAIDQGYRQYLAEATNLRFQEKKDHAAAVQFYHHTVWPRFRAVTDACIKLRELNHETMYAASNRAERVASRAVLSMGIIGAAAVALGIVFSLLLSHLLSRPITALKEAALQIAEGNYQVRVPVSGADELALLSQQFNRMAAGLQKYHEMNVEQILGEKRKSEAIIQSVNDGLMVVDADLLISNLNPKAGEIFAVSPGEAVGRHVLEVVRDEKLFQLIKESLEKGSPLKLAEGEDIFTMAAGGGSRHFQFSIIPVRAPSANLQGVVLLLRDVTRLKELDRLKSEFVMTASHELRTPLTSLGMSVDLLRESAAAKLTEKERELLAASHEDVQRLKALVNELLDLSRIEAGKLELAFEPVNPRILGESAAAIIKPQAEAKNMELSLEIPEDLPEVRADPNKILWVLVNLLANALRFTPDGGHIRLQGERVGPQVQLAVTDDGPGVPYEDQARIFDKFVQVKGAGSVGGSGLGLAISKEIVRAHGGTIWLDSTPGQGSTFTFTLPLAA